MTVTGHTQRCACGRNGYTRILGLPQEVEQRVDPEDEGPPGESCLLPGESIYPSPISPSTISPPGQEIQPESAAGSSGASSNFPG